ncbi:MAG: acyl-CoA dehydrogenase family protein [Deltaproteobacteria bacterium]|nr:acyl-CoA dehydrogenase family protein [Deltaproteobacteria bacterium]
MSFFQTPPSLGNQFRDDRVLRSWLARALPPDARRDIEPSLEAMGELVGGKLYQLQLHDLRNEPKLVQWDAWGHRVDEIELSPLWREAAKIAAEHGVVATGYERRHGVWARVHQFALVYLFDASSDVYTCPLAMTDGAAKTLLTHRSADNQALVDRAVSRLLSRDPAIMWTSGQWMTERTGGSDVGISETVARKTAEGWRLYGDKWFTSATTSQMALTLARPEGNPQGGRGLALFYVERFRPDGANNGISVNRLKDKLGTRKVPTAELHLDGTLAEPIVGLDNGVRNITPMLTVTRTWNAVGALSGMRRSLALARDYASKRVQFGAKLSDKPLHLETLAGMQAEYEAAFHLVFRSVALFGKEEAGVASASESELLRVLTPIIKLMTGKQAVEVVSEAAEAFGGAGYVEDTGVPRLVRDVHVLPIWEGTTNVLSLDVLRALGRPKTAEGPLGAIEVEIERAATTVRDGRLADAVQTSRAAVAHAKAWAAEAFADDRALLEAGARRLSMTLGRALALAVLAEHAQWSLDHERDGRARAAALRFARHGVDLIGPLDLADAALARDEPLRP